MKRLRSETCQRFPSLWETVSPSTLPHSWSWSEPGHQGDPSTQPGTAAPSSRKATRQVSKNVGDEQAKENALTVEASMACQAQRRECYGSRNWPPLTTLTAPSSSAPSTTIGLTAEPRVNGHGDNRFGHNPSTSTGLSAMMTPKQTHNIVMTTCSTFCALGMMPLLLYIYSTGIYEGDLKDKVPYKSIMISLILVLIPCTIGIVLKSKRPQYVRYVVKEELDLLTSYTISAPGSMPLAWSAGRAAENPKVWQQLWAWNKEAKRVFALALSQYGHGSPSRLPGNIEGMIPPPFHGQSRKNLS
ncbi:hypothetical protein P7K49_018257 [Saguinus oedipus]|uniref:Uncharacterized protein n=1 Tax=Saguinus oedipus TaxID=9490 RepID=A0ABQ9V583_SAGOE|nr:hypothetical protein P7K49_018257 [Saguinus oedipus]